MGAFVSGSTASQGKYILLADGENLVFRYQNLLKSRKLNPSVTHIEDVFVWHPNLAEMMHGWSLMRVNYYTSAVGDEVSIAKLEHTISKISVGRRGQAAAQIC